jgi:nicotinate dehydrogenase subunit B
MNRRDWLKTTGGLVVGFTFSGVPTFGGQAVPAVPLSNDGRPLDPKEVDSFLSIHADGSVTVYTSKVDVGTGMRIAMAQMAAEELGVDTARITVVDGDTARCPNTGGTGGSTGLTRGGTAVRQAAATARQALLGLAATRLKRPVADLTIVAGEVRPAAGGRGVRIGALVGGRRLALPVNAKAPLVPPSQYVQVGQSPARPDVNAKCTGRYQYIQDFSVPGMLHGRVIRPPAVGATVVSVDEASVARLPGVRVVRIESFLAVVSDDEWAAVRASRELEAKWTAWRGLPGHDNL